MKTIKGMMMCTLCIVEIFSLFMGLKTCVELSLPRPGQLKTHLLAASTVLISN